MISRPGRLLGNQPRRQSVVEVRGEHGHVGTEYRVPGTSYDVLRITYFVSRISDRISQYQVRGTRYSVQGMRGMYQALLIIPIFVNLSPHMKASIHPAYYPEAKLICACGNVITAGSTVPEIHIELCSKCHPFYTGKQKLIDTARRVEKFQERSAAKTAKAGVSLGRKVKAEKRAAIKQAKKAKKTPDQLNEA